MTTLESGPLGLEGEACLEFWYLDPVEVNGSELRALLNSSDGLIKIWTLPALPRDAWRQVFVPLNVTEPETQVKWQITPNDKTIWELKCIIVTFKHIICFYIRS